MSELDHKRMRVLEQRIDDLNKILNRLVLSADQVEWVLKGGQPKDLTVKQTVEDFIQVLQRTKYEWTKLKQPH